MDTFLNSAKGADMKRTATERELRAWVAEGLTIKQIADKLGRHYQGVAYALNVLGIRPASGKGRVWNERAPVKKGGAKAHAADWYHRFNRGETMSQIAASVGYSVPTVSRVIRPYLA